MSNNRINFNDINFASNEEIDLYLSSVESEDFRQQILELLNITSVKDEVFVNDYAATVIVGNNKTLLFFKLILDISDILTENRNVVLAKIKDKLLKAISSDKSHELINISLLNSVKIDKKLLEILIKEYRNENRKI